VAAIGASAADSFTSEGPAPAEVHAETVIRFTLPPEAKEAGWNGSVLETYSVAAMLAKPELKKAVWAQLKTGPSRRG
jgi:hypothetical protein